eukprot:gb/GECG01007102.1/.p1 GENE.gb/GECG01007102.1/~~gb/GECG01007102.1/.p1  ORF type:complete len:1226 (+),score=152.12 gb/GECG01007102.1/:1-3678(+)
MEESTGFPELPVDSEDYRKLCTHSEETTKPLWKALGIDKGNVEELTSCLWRLLELEQSPQLKEWMQDQSRRRVSGQSPTLQMHSPASHGSSFMHPISTAIASFALDNVSLDCASQLCDKTVCNQPEIRRAAASLIFVWLDKDLKSHEATRNAEKLFDNNDEEEGSGFRGLSFTTFTRWLTQSLTDVWSEIRKETAKKWSLLAQSFSPNTCRELTTTWAQTIVEATGAEDTKPTSDDIGHQNIHSHCAQSEKDWKSIDGLLRGVHSTVSAHMHGYTREKHAECSEDLHVVIRAAQHCIGHSQHSVRSTATLLLDKCAKVSGSTLAGPICEAAIRKLVPKYSASGLDIPICLNQGMWVRNDALAEGCLGLLSYIIHHLDVADVPIEKRKENFFDSIFGYIEELGETAGRLSHHKLYQGAVALSALYLCHHASSVRQAASNMILQASLGCSRDQMKKSIPRLLNVLYVLKGLWDDLISSSDATSHWQALEGLMMSYELILTCLIEDFREAFRPFSSLHCEETSAVDEVVQPLVSETFFVTDSSLHDSIAKSLTPTATVRASHEPLLLQMQTHHREECNAIFERYFRHVSPLITSGIFELRRMAEQLLPVLTELLLWWEDGMDILLTLWVENIASGRIDAEWKFVTCSRTMQLLVDRSITLEKNLSMKIDVSVFGTNVEISWNSPEESTARSMVWFAVVRLVGALREAVHREIPYLLLFQSLSDRTFLLAVDNVFDLVNNNYVGNRDLPQRHGKLWAHDLLKPKENSCIKGNIRSIVFFTAKCLTEAWHEVQNSITSGEASLPQKQRENPATLSKCVSHALSVVSSEYERGGGLKCAHGNPTVNDDGVHQRHFGVTMRSNLISFMEEAHLRSSLTSAELAMFLPLLCGLMEVKIQVPEMIHLLQVFHSVSQDLFVNEDLSLLINHGSCHDVASVFSSSGFKLDSSIAEQCADTVLTSTRTAINADALIESSKETRIQILSLLSRIIDTLFSCSGVRVKRLVRFVCEIFEQAFEPLSCMIEKLNEGFKPEDANALRTPPKNTERLQLSGKTISFPLRMPAKASSSRELFHNSDGLTKKSLHKCHSFETSSWKGPRLSEISSRVSPEIRRALFEEAFGSQKEEADMHSESHGVKGTLFTTPEVVNGEECPSPAEDDWSDWDSASSDWDEGEEQWNPLTPTQNEKRELKHIADILDKWRHYIQNKETKYKENGSLSLGDTPILEKLISTVAG